jgi:hypothetical protein
MNIQEALKELHESLVLLNSKKRLALPRHKSIINLDYDETNDEFNAMISHFSQYGKTQQKEQYKIDFWYDVFSPMYYCTYQKVVEIYDYDNGLEIRVLIFETEQSLFVSSEVL